MLICIDGAVIRISLYGELWKINILILILILILYTVYTVCDLFLPHSSQAAPSLLPGILYTVYTVCDSSLSHSSQTSQTSQPGTLWES